jgi:hypothetical protein
MSISWWVFLVIGSGLLGTSSLARAEQPPSAPGSGSPAPSAEGPAPAEPPRSSAAPEEPAPSSAPGPPYAAPLGWSPSVPPSPSVTAYPRDAGGHPTGDSKAPGKRSWYGWQTLLVYGASASLLAAGEVLMESDPKLEQGGVVLVIAGATGFALGSPIVHLAHGNVGKGFVALALHLGAPIGGGLAGGFVGCAASACSPLATAASLVLGAGAGSLAAVIIDLSVLSYGEPRPEALVGARARPAATLVPSLDLRRDRATVGLTGTF